MKYVFIVCAIIACSALGHFLSQRYKKRKNFWNSLIMLSDKLVVDISFSRAKLAGVVQSFDKTYAKNLFGIRENYLAFLASKDELSKEKLFAKNTPANGEEKDFIFLFFKCLGRLDASEQTKEIENFKTRFLEMKSKADAEHKKYGSLYLKLGFIAGLFIAVLLL